MLELHVCVLVRELLPLFQLRASVSSIILTKSFCVLYHYFNKEHSYPRLSISSEIFRFGLHVCVLVLGRTAHWCISIGWIARLCISIGSLLFQQRAFVSQMSDSVILFWIRRLPSWWHAVRALPKN